MKKLLNVIKNWFTISQEAEDHSHKIKPNKEDGEYWPDHNF